MSEEITVLCSGCQKHLSGPPLRPGGPLASHSLCSACLDKQLANMGMTREEFDRRRVARLASKLATIFATETKILRDLDATPTIGFDEVAELVAPVASGSADYAWSADPVTIDGQPAKDMATYALVVRDGREVVIGLRSAVNTRSADAFSEETTLRVMDAEDLIAWAKAFMPDRVRVAADVALSWSRSRS